MKKTSSISFYEEKRTDWRSLTKEDVLYELLKSNEDKNNIQISTFILHNQKEASAVIIRETISKFVNDYYDEEVSDPMDSWKTLHDSLVQYCNDKYLHSTCSLQKHHITPRRDGGGMGTNIVKCNNIEHNLFHFLLYKISKDDNNLSDIALTRQSSSKKVKRKTIISYREKLQGKVNADLDKIKKELKKANIGNENLRRELDEDKKTISDLKEAIESSKSITQVKTKYSQIKNIKS